ncbi:MAG TPA: aldehyde dehydrogenase family protein, partial [Verrucomicrobiota bacterium]|nr:aldehyde dehydrogenase family protein [Verrucomicrobiota bacterium]
LSGADAEVHPEPFGVVLALARSNYPLLTPGSQALQALAAGNAVVLKPGAGGAPAAQALHGALVAAGLDPRLLAVLPEDAEAGRLALGLAPDFVLLTGAAATGRAVLRQCAANLTPAAAELSGSDAVVVRADADLDRVVAALRFGLRLNDGATCIAPRRVFAHAAVFGELESRLARALAAEAPIPIPPAQAEKLTPLLLAATARGAQVLGVRRPEIGELRGPVVVSRAQPAMRLLHEDVFAPVLALVEVADDRAALAAAALCPYALGASVFSRDAAATRRLAAQLPAGVVTLGLTRPKVVSIRHGRWLPHLDPPREGDAELFAAALRATHARSPWSRLRAGLAALRHAARRGR